MAKILITGGSGLVGTHLSKMLKNAGNEVTHLSRSPDPSGDYPTFTWNLRARFIDEEAFSGVDHIIHLAGAGVADKRWTKDRKKVILESRTAGIRLLHEYVIRLGIRLKSFISASAIGYYGSDTGTEVVTEASPPGDDFLARVVQAWEAEADIFREITTVSKVRVGVVLSEKGGAMVEILKPIKYFLGAPLGSGQQIMSWIHIDDLCRIFQFVMEKELSGTYNATAPNAVTNEALTRLLAKTVNKPLFLPNVPAVMMKLLLGEMSQIVLGGSNVSAAKIQKQGFKFSFTQIDHAVKDLLE
ncbi:MAG: TIGR01777 family oxidoreductase [Marinoscillum sp.]|uniref:TIGR01777 family oxidoreductase n=1 Tax=Marinoscillum sp. TaxID=2024838 RepID=UPI003304D75A